MSDAIIQRLTKAVKALPPDTVTGDLPESAAAALALAAAQHAWTLLICDGTRTLETLVQDAETLAPSEKHLPVVFPPWESLPTEHLESDREISGRRLDALRRLQEHTSGTPLIITSIQALLQKPPPPAAMRAAVINLHTGCETAPQALAEELVARGYHHVHEVTEPGTFVLKGGILDAWSPADSSPLRIEFFGDTVDSLRGFDPASQRSTAKVDSCRLMPASEWQWLENIKDNQSLLLDYLPHETTLIWYQDGSIHELGALHDERVKDAGAQSFAVTSEELRQRISQHFKGRTLRIAADEETSAANTAIDLRPGKTIMRSGRELIEPDALSAARQALFSALKEQAGQNTRVTVFFDSAGSLSHYREAFGSDLPTTLHLRQGVLSGGFESPALNLVVVAENDLLGRPRRSGRATSRASAHWRKDAGERIKNAAELEPGDLVVHVEHGIGIYRGVFEIEVARRKQEVLSIEYAEGARLHVPTTQAHVLSRYVGASAANVRLHRLGGKRWNRERAAAEQAIADLAASLIQTHAEREARTGHAFAPDKPWQHEFEASFPFRETPDQIRVGAEIKSDMESIKPMDRLVCGDAGYGKTEMAIRAAFKCAMEARQTAILVPTTVLAQQHYETFCERMASYPVRIEMLSRFRTGSERSAILKGLAAGTVDIVIGTHGLLNKDMRFNDLGLVIIDEEQRFGVEHKERFKQLRRMVDVLTMTATPIPRTLYMSLSGARDLSLMQTPPVERQAVETIVARASDKLIREAILRELSREGQVFFLHNRVMTIDWMQDRLADLVPEARICMAHGQMPARRLADIMHAFVAGEFDVLLSTTIIESGMDIPRANTILIDRADRFGVADLYQLRGRVGRSSHKGYAYLLLPAQGRVEPDARRRIQALARHSGAGAGFSLALRDLEIRGSGNLLGAAQSGHIAAVGFNLYCQMLRRTVARLKNEPVPDIIDTTLELDFISLEPRGEESRVAVIPYSYIDDETVRVTIYRKLSGEILQTSPGAEKPPQTSSRKPGGKKTAAGRSAQEAALDELHHELTDRFGPPPPAVERLLQTARLRMRASARGISRIETRREIVYLTGKDGRPLMSGGKHPRLTATTADHKIEELLKMVAAI